MTRAQLGPFARFALRLVASLAVLGLVALFVDVGRAVEGLRRLDPAVWAFALASFVVLHVASALKWRWFGIVAGAHIPASAALKCHAAGLFGNLFLPSLIGGDVVRAGLAVRSTDERAALVVASVVDRIADVTALLALVLFALPLVTVGDATPLRALPAVAAALAAGAAAGALLLRWSVRSLMVRRLPRKLARAVLHVAAALRTMRRRPVAAFGGWVGSVGIQSGLLLVNVALGRSMGLDLTLPQWFLLWPLAKIAAMAPVSFGGLGVREAAFAALVAPFGPESLAAAQSFVWQSVLVVGGLLAGAWWAVSSRNARAAGTEAA